MARATIVLCSLLLLCAAPAQAATLGVATPATASFSSALSGVDQTARFTLPMTVSGGGTTGWSLTASATQFTFGTFTLPANATTVTGVADDPSCTGGGCSNPTAGVAITYPLDVSSSQKIFSAAAGSGKGGNVETATIAVAIPSNAFAQAYVSTFTITIAASP